MNKKTYILLVLIFAYASAEAQYKYKVEYDMEYLTSFTGGYNLNIKLVNPSLGTESTQILSYNVSGCISAIETDGMEFEDAVYEFPNVYTKFRRTISCNFVGPCSAGCPDAGSLNFDLACVTDNSTLTTLFPTAIVPKFSVYRILPFAQENNYTVTNNNLKECESRTLVVTSNATCTGGGFAGSISYAVQYQVRASTVWNNLLPYFPRSSEFDISITDFPGLTVGQNLRLRVQYDNPSAGTPTYSDILTYTYTRCSPEVQSHTAQNATCIYSNDGSFTLTFDRPLNAGEVIENINLDYAGEDDVFGTADDFDNYASLPNGSIYSGTTYTWTGIEVGVYRVNYQSAGAASLVQYGSITISSVSSAVDFFLDKTDVDCFNANNGSLEITASGGVGNYQYKLNTNAWANFSSANSHTINGLGPGSYDIQVRDGNQCEAQQ